MTKPAQTKHSHRRIARTGFSGRNGRVALAAGLLVGVACILAACSATDPARKTPSGATAASESASKLPLNVVAPVDLKRYAGLWHEQARLPNRFQSQCTGSVSAEYRPLPNGTVEVKNRCATDKGGVEEVIGQARRVPVDGLPEAGRLEVRFAPAWLGWLPFVWGDYWIVNLDADYRVALVGTPDRKYLWVLSREPRLSDGRLKAELDFARNLGFDVDRVERTGSTPVASSGG